MSVGAALVAELREVFRARVFLVGGRPKVLFPNPKHPDGYMRRFLREHAAELHQALQEEGLTEERGATL